MGNKVCVVVVVVVSSIHQWANSKCGINQSERMFYFSYVINNTCVQSWTVISAL